MKNRISAILILCMYVSISFAQSELDGYKYIIVPKKFDFLKEEDKYSVNSLTKFLFEKKGFTTIFNDGTYPSDLIVNPCLALTAHVDEDSGLFTTKLIIELVDCHNKTVYSSGEGKSKEKDYQKAYHEALRGSFVSIEALNYSYNPSSNMSNTIAPAAVQAETPAAVVPNPPAVIPVVTAAVVTAVVSDANSLQEEAPVEVDNNEDKSISKSYKNDMISFFIMEQGEKLVAIINESKNELYRKGEHIGTLKKTSLPNIYKASWKDQNGKKEETTAYFDSDGNLNVDITRDGEIEVIIFQLEN